MIKLEDLVIGEVYYQEDGDIEDKSHFISRFSGINVSEDTFIFSGDEEFKKARYDCGGTTDEDLINVRKATLEEILWLEACEKNDKFVSRSKIKVKKLTKKQYSKIDDLIKEFDEL